MKNWTILLPYYNEATFLTGTLESIAQQNYKQFRLILINNASTDDSEAIVRRVMKKFPDIEVEYLFEAKPGKTLALQKGLAQVKTPYVATMDADTYYPPNYLGFCNYIFEHYPDYIAVMACDIYKPHHDFKSQKRCRKIYRKSRLFSKQCHTGGFGQAFRTESLNRVKGFDQEHWPYVLEDHEIVHRLLKIGKVYYSPKHWCMPSSRCRTNGSKYWTRFEKFLYQYTPFFLKDWYFYSFLKKRFQKRQASITNLRNHDWKPESLASEFLSKEQA